MDSVYVYILGSTWDDQTYINAGGVVGIPPGGSGSTTISLGNYPYQIKCEYVSGGQQMQSDPQGSSGGSSATFNLAGAGSCTNIPPPPTNSPCMTNMTISWFNDEHVPVYVEVVGALGSHGSFLTAAGQAGSYSANVPCNDIPWGVEERHWYENSNNIYAPLDPSGITNGSGTASPIQGTTQGQSPSPPVPGSSALPPGGAPSQQIISTNGNGTVQTNIVNPTTPPILYYSPTNYSTGQQAPILFTSEPNSTNNALISGEGFQALYTELSEFAGQNHTDIQSLLSSSDALSNALYGIGNGTNGEGTDTNLFPTNLDLQMTQVGISNLLALSYSNQQFAATNNLDTNALNTNFVATTVSRGTAAGQEINTAFGNLVVPAGLSSADDAGQGSTTIPIGGTQTMTLSSAIIPIEWLHLARTIAGIFIFWLMFRRMVDCTQSQILGVIGQPQAGGLVGTTPVVGDTAHVSTGLAYLAIISAAIVAIPVAVSATLYSFGAGISDPTSAFGSLAGAAGGFPWAICAAGFPLAALISSVATYFSYRYILMFPVLVVARMIILFCIR